MTLTSWIDGFRRRITRTRRTARRRPENRLAGRHKTHVEGLEQRVLLTDPIVSVQLGGAGTITEGGAGSSFQITRGPENLEFPLTVNVRFTGSADPGSNEDYTLSGVNPGPGTSGSNPFSTSVDFSPAQPVADVYVDAIDDFVSEGNENVSITLLSGTGYTVQGGSATITITDGISNNPPDLSSISDQTVDELSQLSLWASATDPDSDPLTFKPLESVPGAQFPTGASITQSGHFTWQPTEAQGPGVYWVRVRVEDNPAFGSPLSDTTDFMITVNEVNQAPVLTGIPDQSINAGQAKPVNFTATDSDEPYQQMTFTATSSNPSVVSVSTPSYSQVDGTANGTITLTAANVTSTQTVTITVDVSDQFSSPPGTDSEQFVVTVVPPTPLVTISAPNPAAVPEGTGPGTSTARFSLNLSGAPGSQGAIVGYSILPDGTYPADNADFVVTTGSATFSSTQTQADVDVEFVRDSTIERDETYKVQITTISGNVGFGATQSAGGTIENDDFPEVTITGQNLTEGDEEDPGTSTPLTFTFDVSLSEAPPSWMSSFVDYKVEGDGADPADDVDFSSAMNGTLSFSGGQTQQTITVTVSPDDVAEADEEFKVTLENEVDLSIGTPDTATGKIINDDLPTASLSPPSQSIEEGNTGTTTLTYDVSLNAPAGGAGASVDWNLDGTGPNPTDGTDFSGPTWGTVTFTAGASLATIDIDISTDLVIEPDEDFEITLNPQTASGLIVSSSAGSALGTIEDDDLPTVSLDDLTPVADTEAWERGSDNTARYQLTRLGGNTAASLVVNFDTSTGVADNGVDYTLSVVSGGSISSTGATGSVTFDPGVTSLEIELKAEKDSDLEGDELATITLTADPNYAINNSSVSGTIHDSPHVKIEATVPDAFESTMFPFDTGTYGPESLGTSPGAFQITLINPSAGPVMVPFTWDPPGAGIANPPDSGTSTPPDPADKDYDLSPSFGTGGGTVTLSGSQTITVNPVDDEFIEGSEDAVFRLTDNPALYVIEQDTATVTIHDIGLMVIVVDDDSIEHDEHLDGQCDCECGHMLTSEIVPKYSDDAADPAKTIVIDATILPRDPAEPPNPSATPEKMKVTVEVRNQDSSYSSFNAFTTGSGGGGTTSTRDIYFDITDLAQGPGNGFSTGEPIRMGVRMDFSAFETGFHLLDFTVSTVYSDGKESIKLKTSLNHGVLNLSQSGPGLRPSGTLGKGWSFSGEHRIGEQDRGVWLAPGDGTIEWFRKPDPNVEAWEAPRGSFLELTKDNNGDFVLTDKYFTRKFFDPVTGRLESEIDRTERTTTYDYWEESDASDPNYADVKLGMYQTIKNHFDSEMAFSYDDTTGALTSIRDFDGIVYTFNYDSANDWLESVETPDPDGSGTRPPTKIQYSYDQNNNRLKNVKLFEDGATIPKRHTEFTRNGLGIATQEVHHDQDHNGNPASWSLNPIGLQLALVDLKDPTVATEMNPASVTLSRGGPGIELESTRTAPDQSGAAISIDFRGDVVSSKRLRTNGLQHLIWHVEYDENGLPITNEQPDSAAGQLRYEYEYDEKGNLKTLTTIPSNLPQRVQTWTYDTMGVGAAPKFSQVTKYKDEYGRETDYLLDIYGNVTQITEPPDTGVEPRVTTIGYYGPSGNPDLDRLRGLPERIVEPDPDGSGPELAPFTLFRYDTRGPAASGLPARAGRLKRILQRDNDDPDPANSWPVQQHEWVYNASGSLTDIGDAENSGVVGYLADLSSQNGRKQPQLVIEAPSDPTVSPRRTRYTYDGFGRTIQIALQDPDGGVAPGPTYDFTYDGRGNLTQVLYPAIDVLGENTLVRPSETMTYDFDGRLTSYVDPNGNTTAYEYDDLGRLVKETLPDTTIVEYTWDDRDELLSMIVDGGTLAHTEYTYDAFGRLKREVDKLRDPNGDDPAVWSYELSSPDYSYTDMLGRKTEYNFNNVDELVRVIQPDPDILGDPGPVWQYEYDAVGRLITVKDPMFDAAVNPDRKTTYNYDPLSRLERVTLPDPDGSGSLPAPFTAYTYSANSDVLTETIQRTEASAPDRTTTHTYDRLGQLLTTTLPSPRHNNLPNLTMSWDYDHLGRVESTVDQRGETTSYTWNDLSLVETVTLPDPDGTGPLGQPVQSYFYDRNTNLAAVDVPGPTGSPLRTTYGYDSMDRITTVAAPQPGSDGTLPATTTTAYDHLGRITSITDHLGNETEYEYNDGDGKTTMKEPSLDPLNPHTTVLSYDLVGNLISLKDASNNTTNFAYDHLDRLVTETDAFGKPIIREYNGVGQLTKEYSRILNGTTQNRTYRHLLYDDLGRVTRENWHGSTASQANFHSMRYTYDEGGRLDNVKELRGSQGGPPKLEYDYTYDDLDRLVSVEDTANTAAHAKVPSPLATVKVKLDYEYDAQGDMIKTSAAIQPVGSQQFQADFVNDYQHDALGRVTQIVQDGGTGITRKQVDIEYNEAGQYKEIMRSVGTGPAEVATASYSYFGGGGLQSIDYAQGATALTSYGYTYDAIGRVSTFTAPEGTFTYGYDPTHQLTSVAFAEAPTWQWLSADESFTYDATGNRQGSGQVVDRNRLMKDAAGNDYLYTDDGNTYRITSVTDGSYRQFIWDGRQRMAAVDDYSSSGTRTRQVSYTYDAFDRLVMKELDMGADGAIEETERSVWDGDQVALVLDENGAVKHRFLHGPDVDQVFADESGTGDVLWYLTDAQNTVRDVVKTDPQTTVAEVINHLVYSAFGEILSETNLTTGADASSETPYFAYTGREWDEDTELQYNRARWYDPSTGRWMSEDPIRWNAGDTNLYRYGSNTPANVTDPTGKWSESGHFYTVYFMARMSGMTHKRSKQLATWTQYPDETASLDAYRLYMGLKDAIEDGKPKVFDRMVGRTFKNNAARQQYLVRVQQLLHFLTGERSTASVKKRRRALEVLIGQALKENDVALAGLALHAYGDGFAHTKVEGGVLCTYPTGVGHGIQSAVSAVPTINAEPDQIRNHGDAYRDYIRGLARIFQIPAGNNSTLDRLRRQLQKAESDEEEIKILQTFSPAFSYILKEEQLPEARRYFPEKRDTPKYFPTNREIDRILSRISKSVGGLVNGDTRGLPNATGSQ